MVGHLPGVGSVVWRGAGFERLPAPPRFPDSSISAVSAHGTVVVGSCFLSSLSRPCRWRLGEPAEVLGTFGGEFGGAADVSANGRVVVGHASDAQDVYWAFRWVETYGLQNLGSLGGQGSHARGFGGWARCCG